MSAPPTNVHSRPAEPDAAAVRRLFAGTEDPDTAEELWRHLRNGCDRCRRLVMRELEQGPARMPAAYEPAFGRSFQGLQRRARMLERERIDAVERAERLVELDEDKRDLLIRNVPAYRTWAVAERLLQRTEESLWRNDASERVRSAELAVRVSQALDLRRYGALACADLQGRAWSELGNQHRIQNRFAAAVDAFHNARQRLECGTGDTLLTAHLASLEISLLLAGGQYRQALKPTSRVLASLGSEAPHLRANLLIKLGDVQRTLRLPHSVETLSQALSLLSLDNVIIRQMVYLERAAAHLVDGKGWLAERDFLTAKGLARLTTSDPHRFSVLCMEADLLSLAGEDRASLRCRNQAWEMAGSSERLVRHLPLVSADLIVERLRLGESEAAHRTFRRCARILEFQAAPPPVLQAWSDCQGRFENHASPHDVTLQVRQVIAARWYEAG